MVYPHKIATPLRLSQLFNLTINKTGVLTSLYESMIFDPASDCSKKMAARGVSVTGGEKEFIRLPADASWAHTAQSRS